MTPSIARRADFSERYAEPGWVFSHAADQAAYDDLQAAPPRMPELTLLEELALALVDEGASRATAASICGVSKAELAAALSSGRAKRGASA